MQERARRLMLAAMVSAAVFGAAAWLGSGPAAGAAAAEKGGETAVVFSNPEPIAINTVPSGTTAPTRAALYPSTIAVSGMTGTVTKVEVTLKGLSHALPLDADFLLVGPTGAKFIFLSDSGPFAPVDDRVYTFRDDAPTTFREESGAYRPTSGDAATDTFPSPAPAGPYSIPPAATFASVFNGTDPNGTWSLYAVDDQLTWPGEIVEGWSITVTTTGSPATAFANTSTIALGDIVAVATPYGSTIPVSGLSGVISKVTVTLNGVSHTRPDDIDILLVSPNGRGLVLMSDAGGSQTATNANLTFDDAGATTIGTVMTGTYRPTDNVSEGTNDSFASPAPMRPYFQGGSPLSVFNGFSPNGEWRLFVVDDGLGNSGSIAGGWSLDITTVPAPPPAQAACAVPSFSPTNFGVGINPTGVAVADFNGDGSTDLAVTNQVSGDVSIMMGNGGGGFSPGQPVTAGSSPYAVTAGRFNADNFVDLAVANSGSNNVSVLLGHGNGLFAAPVSFVVGPTPISIAAGDVNNDSKQDLIVANFGSFFAGSVSVLLGNGSGGFAATSSVRTRTQPSFVYPALLNGDGDLDLIVSSFGSNSVSTYFGLGTGSFQLSQNLNTGSGPVSIAMADLTGDGVRELLVTNFNGDSVTTCTGTTNGSFTSCSNSGGFGPNPISIATAQFTGPGVNSFVVALSGASAVRTSFATDTSTGQNPNAVATGDFNSDGKPDIVSVNSGSNDISVLINRCQVARGNYFDFNGDRKTDYSVFRPAGAAWWIQGLSSGNPAYKFGRPGDMPMPADYNGDLRTDAAFYRPETGLWFVIEQSGRTIYQQKFGFTEDVPAPADYDGDGKADIAVWRPSQGFWYVRKSTDNSILIGQWGIAGDRPVPADYDGDGKDDFAVFRPSEGVWYIFRSSDNQIEFKAFGIAEDKTVQGDYDGDGKADVAVWRPSTGVWYVLRSSDGDFRAFRFGLAGDIPVVGDYDADGKFDYAVWRPSEGFWYVWKSSDSSAQYFLWGAAGDIPLPASLVR
ncbi:MAG: FG-GAP repeat domain-containing protein [Pyrinomonadaceae bacterium]